MLLLFQIRLAHLFQCITGTMYAKLVFAMILIGCCHGNPFQCPSSASIETNLKPVVKLVQFEISALTIPRDLHNWNSLLKIEYVRNNAMPDYYPSLLPYGRKKLTHCPTGDHYKQNRYETEYSGLCGTSLQYECLENEVTGDILEFCAPVMSCLDRTHYFAYHDEDQQYVVYLKRDECQLGSFVNSCFDKEGCVPNIAFCTSDFSPKMGQCNVQEGFCNREGTWNFSLENGYNNFCKFSACPHGEDLLQDCSCAPKCPIGLYRVGNSTCLWLDERPRDTSGTMNGTVIFEPLLPINTSVIPVENTTKAPDTDVSKPPSNQDGSSDLKTIVTLVAVCVSIVLVGCVVGLLICFFRKRKEQQRTYVEKTTNNNGCNEFHFGDGSTVNIVHKDGSGGDHIPNLVGGLGNLASVADGSDCALLDEPQP